MINSDRLERIVYETIDNEINDFIHSSATQAVMYGYYSAWVQILEGIQKTSDSKDETDAKMADAAAYVSCDWQGEDAEVIPLRLMRDFLEDYCRKHLLPDDKDSAAFKVIDASLDCVEWCCEAQEMEEDFCDPDNN